MSMFQAVRTSNIRTLEPEARIGVEMQRRGSSFKSGALRWRVHPSAEVAGKS